MWEQVHHPLEHVSSQVHPNELVILRPKDRMQQKEGTYNGVLERHNNRYQSLICQFSGLECIFYVLGNPDIDPALAISCLGGSTLAALHHSYKLSS